MQQEELLDQYTVDTLKSLARQIGLSKPPTRKANLVQALVLASRGRDPSLLPKDGDGMASTITLLPADLRNLLAEAAHNKSVSPAMFESKYRTPCPNMFAYSIYRTESPLGVLFMYQAENRHIVLCDDLRAELRSLLPKPPQPVLAVTDSLPASLTVSEGGCGKKTSEQRTIQVYEGEQTTLPELSGVLSMAQTGKLKVTPKNLRPTTSAERLLGEILVQPDFQLESPEVEQRWKSDVCGPVRAHAWAVLVQQCGWCRPYGSTLTVTAAGRAMLARPTPAAFREGVLRFLRNDDFDELNRINNIRGQGGRGARDLTRPSLRRAAAWNSMQQWPAGSWAVLNDAFHFIFASGNVFITSSDTMTLYIQDPQYGYLGDAGDELERQYIRSFFMESLATLGLIDVAFVYPHYIWPELGDAWGTDSLSFCSRYDGLLYVRLNRLGEYCLGRTNSWQAQEATHRDLLKILPNRDVVLSADRTKLSGPDRHLLDLFTSRKSDDVWHLDRDRILDHAETGGTVEDVRKFLEQRSSAIPDNVRVWLDDVERALGTVLGATSAVLVEMADPAAAALIANDSQAGKHVLLAGPRHLAVPVRHRRALAATLRKHGFILPVEMPGTTPREVPSDEQS